MQESHDSAARAAHGLPPALEAGPSPLWPEHLVDLFVRPRRFFAGQLALGHTPWLVFVTWCYGMTGALDRLDRMMLRADLGRPQPGWEQIGPWVTGSWLGFWLWVLTAGALSGVFLYWVGGWWYRVRLGWCGAVEPDARLARLVLVYASFVLAAPTLLWLLAQTLVFPSYAAYWSSDETWSLGLLIFPFWSIVTSYVGARTSFQLVPWKALVWFAVLPACLYVAAFGLLATLYALFGSP